jgi:lipoprotein-releasing system permease protein
MRFEFNMAMRHLVSGGGQTWLTISAVAIAVAVIIFIQTLITGVQQRFLKDLVGSLPHITVKAPDPAPTTLDKVEKADANTFYATDSQKTVQQRVDVEHWEALEQELAQFPGVRTVTSVVRGNAFLSRGEKRFGVTVSGADPPKQEKIALVQKDMLDGRWLDIGPDEIVIGVRLAEEMGVKVGDQVRIVSPLGVSNAYRVAGIFYSGNNAADYGQVYMTLRAAQQLFGTGENVSSVLIKLDDAFQANTVADAITASLPYKTESWMREQAFIVNAITSQNSTRDMICAFVLLASAFGIASVLIVSVIQKSKQIGILKSMGARDAQIRTIFTLEGLMVAIVGCILGSSIGFALLRILADIPQSARFGKVDKLFNIIYDPNIFLGACAAAILATLLAAYLPAQRASKMNPVEVIRG